jgi:hypothetical protein
MKLPGKASKVWYFKAEMCDGLKLTKVHSSVAIGLFGSSVIK